MKFWFLSVFGSIYELTNQCVFYIGCPINLCFGVEPFGIEKMAPITKIFVAENTIKKQKFYMAKKLF